MIEAGVERAKGLVSAVASDADNLFITISARVLNPKLFILVRADEEQTEKKLLRAGANRVVMPYLIGVKEAAMSLIWGSFFMTSHTISICCLGPTRDGRDGGTVRGRLHGTGDEGKKEQS